MMKVNRKICVGCAGCAHNYPEIFNMFEGAAEVINKDHDLIEAVAICPVKAISIE